MGGVAGVGGVARVGRDFHSAPTGDLALVTSLYFSHRTEQKTLRKPEH